MHSSSAFRRPARRESVITSYSIHYTKLYEIANPARIPIFVEGSSDIEKIGIGASLLQLLPSSAFEVFANGLFILPLCAFGAFAGAGCAVDKNDAKATLTLFDSLARVSYSIMTFFVDSVAIGLIAVSLNWALQFRGMLASKVFLDFIVLLAVDLLILAVVVWPVAIRLTCGKVNPFRVLYASLASILAAFISVITSYSIHYTKLYDPAIP